MQSISSGVPQGSILGPLLFIIFYRDLPATSTSKTAMLADDTLIHDCCKGIPAASSSASVCTCSLSRDLQLISDWADEWQTSFNASKTVHMLFRRKHRRHTPSPSPVLPVLNSNEIPFAESTRHLGVTLTSTLSWSEHISNVIQRHIIYFCPEEACTAQRSRRCRQAAICWCCSSGPRVCLRPLGRLSEAWSHRSGRCPASYCTLCSSLPPPRSSQLGGAETNRLAHSGMASSTK